MHSLLITNTWEKKWQEESDDRMEQYHMKFVEKIYDSKRRRRKAFI